MKKIKYFKCTYSSYIDGGGADVSMFADVLGIKPETGKFYISEGRNGFVTVRIDEEINREDNPNGRDYEGAGALIKEVDPTEYFNYVTKKARKIELKKEMDVEFKRIDKEEKYKIYAGLDKNFEALYNEYTEL